MGIRKKHENETSLFMEVTFYQDVKGRRGVDTPSFRESITWLGFSYQPEPRTELNLGGFFLYARIDD
jgi:hypothetical protein